MSEIDYSRINRDAVRKALLMLVDSIAAGGTSGSWGKATPYLDSLIELRCMWFDDFYHGAQTLIDDGIFTPEEAVALDRFSEAFRHAYSRTYTPSETNINKLQDDPTWRAVVNAARSAQEEFNLQWSL